MIKFSSTYSTVNNNYIININNNINRIRDEELFSTYNVLQNIIQRGNPTKPSKYLLKKLGKNSINKKLRYISSNLPNWCKTIKGNDENQDNPARIFFEDILPYEIGEDYKFIINLMIPEAKISDITQKGETEFYQCQVDFYIPECKIVIEIDGVQHNELVNKYNDIERVNYLKTFNIQVLRIPVSLIKSYSKNSNCELKNIIANLKNTIINNEKVISYKESMTILQDNKITEVIYDGIMRFQILLIQLLKCGLLDINSDRWEFCIKTEDIKIPYNIAIEDIFIWLENLMNLQCKKFTRPKIYIQEVNKFTDSKYKINIDFSMLKRWDDTIFTDNIIYVRNAYFNEYDYYEVATSELIKYKIIQEGEDSNVSCLSTICENIFGFRNFNKGQLPIIINSLKLTDTIGLLPTGSGKSLCYQLSCLLQPAINFAVVPIKSLMYDQKYNLDKKGITHTNYVSSDQNENEKDIIMNDFSKRKYMCIWISPERFQSQKFRDKLTAINLLYNIGYAVVDEVHCLSEWGHDFRTSYLNLARTIRKLCPASIFLGLTATASKNVLKDILVEFEMDESNVKTILDYTRKELEFRVIQDCKGKNEDKEEILTDLLTEINREQNISKVNEDKSKCALIFTPHVNGKYGCYTLSNKLNSKPEFKGAVKYYSGEVPKNSGQPIMKTEEFNNYKIEVQNEFQNNKFPILVATKAFGMGVDKENVRYTIHYGLPQSIESFYQEAGRAGRDKNKAICYLLNSKDKIDKSEYDKIFSLNATIEDLNYINKKHKYSSDDILRNLFLLLSGNKGVKEECYFTSNIYSIYCAKNKPIITINGVKKLGIKYKGKEIECNFKSVQKAIYRLSLLGIIKDWTIEQWGNRGTFKIEYGDNDYESAFNSLNKYIRKYDVEFNLNDTNIEKYKKYQEMINNPSGDKIYNLIYILIQWSYDNIFYSRRLSQKNLLDLCDKYFENGQEYFKNTLEGYFRITNDSFRLDYLASNPKDFKYLFEVIFDEKGKIKSIAKLNKIRITLIRFLESYRYNTSLNYLSGILALILDDYNNDNTTKERFISSFETINTLDKELKNEIYLKTIIIAKSLDEKNRDSVSEVLCDYFDKNDIYNELNDNVSLCKIIQEKINILDRVWRRLNG